MQTETANIPATVTESKSKSVKPDFGNGKHSPLMAECYHDAQTVFGLESPKAEKLARQIASDYGAAMSGASVKMKSVKIGKANEDGKVTVSEAASRVKGVTLTHALLALTALKYAGDAGNHGFSFGQTKWEPVKPLKDYFDSL